MIVEYIWLDGDNNPRSKTKVVTNEEELQNLPI